MEFSKRAKKMKASAIGELLRQSGGSTCISFAGGLPDENLFPDNDLAQAMATVFAEKSKSVLQYGDFQGVAELRDFIGKKRMGEKFGLSVPADQILITTGSQQGIDVVSRAYLNPGDVVLIESPSYVDALNVFTSYGAVLKEIPSDEKGMLPDELERILREDKKVKLIYVIPDFQNPTGKTWSLERRRAFVELIEQYDIPVIEDNPYGELHFDGPVLPSLASLNQLQQVLFLGSFSKILSPGIRIGWVCAGPDTLHVLSLCKEATDIHCVNMTQEMIVAYVKRHDLNAHIEYMCGVYKKRRDAMVQAVRKYFPSGTTFSVPGGGFFLWVVLPEKLNATKALPEVMARFVLYVPGAVFYPSTGAENTLRLNFSNCDEVTIEKGIHILGDIFNSKLCIDNV